jgi:hypothetical protein
MFKKIALCLAFVAGTAVMATGCDDNGDTTPDMGGVGGGNNDQGTGPGNTNPDGGGDTFTCVQNPMTNDDFLNSCHSSAVAQEDIVPFYPTLAPNGQLPKLQ